MTRHFYRENNPSPAFIIVVGLVALLAAAAISRQQHDSSVFVGASVAVPFLVAGVFWLYRVGRSTFAQRHVRLLVGLYILAQVALILWDLASRR